MPLTIPLDAKACHVAQVPYGTNRVRCECGCMKFAALTDTGQPFLLLCLNCKKTIAPEKP